MVNEDKIRADNLILLSMILSLLLIFFIFDKIILTAFFVYPMMAFLTQGVVHLYKGINKKNTHLILWGICEIIFCVLMLGYVLLQPTVRLSGILVLIAYPLIFTGFAGLIKSIIIDAYTLLYRVINLFLGIATIIFSVAAITFSEIWSLGQLSILLTLLILNIIFRSALYLSEFGLSVKNIENFRVVFLIIDGYFLKLANRDFDAVEDSDDLNK